MKNFVIFNHTSYALIKLMRLVIFLLTYKVFALHVLYLFLQSEEESTDDYWSCVYWGGVDKQVVHR